MLERTATRTVRPPTRAPAWARALLIFAASRVFSTALLGGLFLLATALGWPFASVRSHPDFFTFSGSWDAWYYRVIAEHGYPLDPPRDAGGHLLPNAWAFLPLFPALERGLSAVTGLTTYTSGVLVATAAGAGAAVLLERLLRPQVGPRRALGAVALLSFGPLAFLLQVAYAESLFLLLVLGCLGALQRGRFLTAVPFGVAAAATRPGALALAGAIVLQAALAWWRARRRPPEAGRRAVAAGLIAAAALAWPLVADLATGGHHVYLDTELAWWTGWVGRPPFVPFTPWFLITSRWLGPAGVIAAVGVAVATAVWLLRGGPRRLGTAVRCFSAAYLIQLAAVFLPQMSLPRLLLPLAGLLGADTFTGTRRRFLAWLVAGAALQPVAVVLLWFLSYP